MNHNEYMKQYNKTYLKTKNGFLRRLYVKMKSRISGSHGYKSKYYIGRELTSLESFMDWSYNNEIFNVMFDNWESSGYSRKFVPSIDRINSERGYTLDNMEFVTVSENSRRSHLNRRKSNDLL